MKRSAATGAMALATWMTAGAAFAQPRAATADELFDKAKRLADAGQMAAACPIFAESYKLDSKAVGVLLYMGACHESTGNVATAWTTFREARAAAARTNQADRARIADARIAALEPRLPRLRLILPKEAQSQGWTIRRDDIVLSSVVWQDDIPVDPGMCRIEVLAPNHRPYVTTALLLEGATTKVAIPSLEPDAIQLRGIPVSEGASTPPVDDGPVAPSAWTTMHTGAAAAGAIGVVGLAIGAGFGVAASSDWSDAEMHCDQARTPWSCDSVGVAAHDDASSKATVSTTAFVLGGAAVATGAVLWFLAPRHKEAPSGSSSLALAGGPGDVGLGLRRSF